MAQSQALNNAFALLDVVDVTEPAYGAVSYATRAAAIAGTDSTAAITTALATGKNVRIPPGYYLWTGGVTMSKVGQKMRGSGTADTSGSSASGTILVKGSGTDDCMTLTQTHQEVADILFDGNDLAGSQLSLNACKYCHFRNLAFTAQGGTDYALHLWAGAGATTNLNNFYDMKFLGDNNYGEILIEAALYSNFFGIHGSEVTGGDSINIGKSGFTISNLNFYGVYGEGAVNIHDVSQDIRFYGLDQETLGTIVNNIIANGANVQDIEFFGWRASRDSAGSGAFVAITDTRSISFEGVHVRDDYSAAGHTIFAVEAAINFSVGNAHFRSTNDFNGFVFTGTNAYIVTLQHIAGQGGTMSHTFKCSALTLVNVDGDKAFSAGQDSTEIFGGLGTITTTNLDLSNSIIAMSSRLKFPTYVQAAKPSPTNVYDAVLWEDSDDNSMNWVVKGVGGVVALGPLEPPTTNSVASPAAGTLTLPTGSFVLVTGTNNITSITASYANRRVTLLFDGVLTLTDGSNLVLAGNFATTADDTITLVCNGTNWYEVARSLN